MEEAGIKYDFDAVAYVSYRSFDISAANIHVRVRSQKKKPKSTD